MAISHDTLRDMAILSGAGGAPTCCNEWLPAAGARVTAGAARRRNPALADRRGAGMVAERADEGAGVHGGAVLGQDLVLCRATSRARARGVVLAASRRDRVLAGHAVHGLSAAIAADRVGRTACVTHESCKCGGCSQRER